MAKVEGEPLEFSGWRGDELSLLLARSPSRKVKLALAGLHLAYVGAAFVLGTLWPPLTLLLLVLWGVVMLYTTWRLRHETAVIEARFNRELRQLHLGGSERRIPDDGVLLVERFRRKDRLFRRFGFRHEGRASWIPNRAALARYRRSRRRGGSSGLVPWLKHDEAVPPLPAGSMELAKVLPSWELQFLVTEMAFALRLPLVDLLATTPREVQPVATTDRLALLSAGELIPPPADPPRRIERIERPGELCLRIGVNRRLARRLVAASSLIGAGLIGAAWLTHTAPVLSSFCAVSLNLMLAMGLLEHGLVRITTDGVQLAIRWTGLFRLPPPMRYAELSSVQIDRLQGRRPKRCALTLAGTAGLGGLELRPEEAEYVRACILHPPARAEARAAPYR